MWTPRTYSDFAEAAADSAATCSAELAGFDPKWREGSEGAIAEALLARLMSFLSTAISRPARVLIDIGAGASQLAVHMNTACERVGIKYVAVDAPEVLAHLPEPRSANILCVPGRFPDVLHSLSALPAPRYVVAYSVAHYLRRPSELVEFALGMASLIGVGGVALLGDLPNGDLKARTIAQDQREPEEWNPQHFTDQEVLDLVALFRSRGLNSYVVPGVVANPLSPHREDIVATRGISSTLESRDGQ